MAKILIIDDDQILQRMYQQKLVSVGHLVVAALDGRSGLELVKTEKPDLILLDIMLPGGMNGFDVLEQLKKNDETKNVKVLVLTNLDTEEKVAEEIGASGYLVKSSTHPDQVVEAVEKLLK